MDGTMGEIRLECAYVWIGLCRICHVLALGGQGGGQAGICISYECSRWFDLESLKEIDCVFVRQVHM